jgi:AraC-like DNA-binding protein
MYEPKRPPIITSKTLSLPEMRYGIVRCDAFVDIEDPTMDPLHIHGYLEVFFNLSKDVSFLVNDTVYPVAKGEILINRPNDVHVCIFPCSDVYDYGCLWIDADAASPLFSFLYAENFAPILSFGEEKRKEAFDLLLALLDLQKRDPNGLKAISLLLRFLSLLSETGADTARTSPLPQPLSEIIRYIKQGFMEIRSVSDITQRFFISASTLNRWFRAYLHTSPREYIEMQRLAYAMELLRGGASVTAAAANAGFSDCSHFIVLFKKKFGQTPLEYKKLCLP